MTIVKNEPSSRSGCLSIFLPFLKFFGGKAEVKSLPYRVSDRFLSAAELSFFLVLRQVVKERAVVCVKVNLGDLFFVTDKEEKTAHKNRIDRKHVDFLLCDPTTMRPLAGVELDDASHGQKKRQVRDAFVEEVFEAAGLPLLRQPVLRAYEPASIVALVEPVLSGGVGDFKKPATPSPRPSPVKGEGANHQNGGSSISADLRCPKCNTVLVRRTASKGAHAGKEFWACPNFPDCRHVQNV